MSSQEEGLSERGSQVWRRQVVSSVAEVSLGSPTVLWGRFRRDMRTWRARELEGAMTIDDVETWCHGSESYEYGPWA